MRLFNRLGQTVLLLMIVAGVSWMLGCAATQPAERSSTSTGAQISASSVNAQDARQYRSVKIGDKIWMSENVNVKTGNSWCYNEDESNCSKYGRLYDWNTAKTVCPTGWHLPSRQEWDDLVTAVGGSDEAENALKSTDGWGGFGGSAGTDDYKFSALPGGRRYNVMHQFLNAGESGYWWMADDEGQSENAYSFGLGAFGGVNFDEKENGYSVRCVQN